MMSRTIARQPGINYITISKADKIISETMKISHKLSTLIKTRKSFK